LTRFVLERVEGDGREAPAGTQDLPGQRERALERAELVVDRDADRLEGALGGVAAAERVAAGIASLIASASSAVVSIGRRRTISAAIRRANRSSPYS